MEAVENEYEDIVKIIAEQPNMDYNIKTEDGKTLAHRAIDSPIDVETFTTLDTFDCWNIPDPKFYHN